MDRTSGKRHLHGETSPSSDTEYLASPAKQPKISIEAKYSDVTVNVLSPEKASTSKDYLISPSKPSNISIERVPSEITVTAIQPEEASTPEEYLGSPAKQPNISIERVPSDITVIAIQPEEASTPEEYLGSPAKQPNISIERVPSEVTVTALQPEEDSTSEGTDSELDLVSETKKSGSGPLGPKASIFKNAIEYLDKAAKQTLDSLKLTKNEVEGFSSQNASTTTAGSTSKMKDYAVVWGDVIETPKQTPENASAHALEEEYMAKYASIYSKELLFATDVVYLVRLLHGLDSKPISYVTSGVAPKSPCDDAMDDALKVLWERTKIKNGPKIENHMRNTGIDYTRFQKMMLLLAKVTEQKRYNTARLLKYCVTVAHWAVCAEKKGVPKAVEFAPLVICRTFQKLKDAGKITSEFWERMAQKAEDIKNKANIQ